MPLEIFRQGDATERLSLVRSAGATGRLALPVDTLNWTWKTKSENETVNDWNVLQDDDELIVTVPNATRFAIVGALHFTSNNIPDFKYQITGSVAPTFFHCSYWAIAAGETAFTNIVTNNAADATGLQQIIGPGGIGSCWFDGTVYNNTGASLTLTIQWAQNTANASDTIVYAGSRFGYLGIN